MCSKEPQERPWSRPRVAVYDNQKMLGKYPVQKREGGYVAKINGVQQPVQLNSRPDRKGSFVLAGSRNNSPYPTQLSTPVNQLPVHERPFFVRTAGL